MAQRKSKASSKARATPNWADADEKSLMRRRLCNLGLRIEGTLLEGRIERLYGELEAKGLKLRPHVWLSNGFFSPDGVPGFAVPFYLAHPRLTRLELACVGRVEGADEEEFLRVVRHETGHALMNAYQLQKQRSWSRVFGRYSAPYRVSYKPDPKNRDFVLNLDGWYGQSHPAEDFCETFAVWLRPRSTWRKIYARTNALAKLEYVDAEMKRIGRLRPLEHNRERVEPLSELSMTLGQFYRSRRQPAYADMLDPGLRGLFSPRKRAREPSAAAYLRRQLPHLVRAATRLSGKREYDVEQVVKRLIERSCALDLVVQPGPGRSRLLSALVTVEVLKIYLGRRPEFGR
jgi:hypothetical protein